MDKQQTREEDSPFTKERFKINYELAKTEINAIEYLKKSKNDETTLRKEWLQAKAIYWAGYMQALKDLKCDYNTEHFSADEILMNRISFFEADTEKIRKKLYKIGYCTEIQPNILRVYKPICPMLANRRHICDIVLTDNNRKCVKITNIRMHRLKQAAKIAFLLGANKDKQ